MELEPVIQRFEADTVGFAQTVDQIKRDLVTTGAAGDQAARQINAAFQRSGASAQQWGGQLQAVIQELKAEFPDLAAQIDASVNQGLEEGIASAARTAQTGGQSIAHAFDGVGGRISAETKQWSGYMDFFGRSVSTHRYTIGRQLEMMALNFATGGASIRGLATQATLLVSAINPGVGTMIALGVAAVSAGAALLGFGQRAREAKLSVEDITKSIQALGAGEAQIRGLTEAISALNSEGRQMAGVELKIDTQKAQQELESARTEMIGTVEQMQNTIKGLQEQAIGVPAAPQMTAVVNQLTALRDIVTDDKVQLTEAATQISEFAQQAAVSFPEVATAAAQASQKISELVRAAAENPGIAPAARQQIVEQINQLIAQVQPAPLQLDVAVGKIDPALFEQLNRAKQDLQEGLPGAAGRVVAAFQAIGEAARGVLPDLSAQALQNAKDFQTLQTRLEAIQAGLKAIGAAESAAAASRLSGAQEAAARFQEAAAPPAPGPVIRPEVAAAARTSFDVVRETEELQKQGYSREAISAIQDLEHSKNITLIGDERRLVGLVADRAAALKGPETRAKVSVDTTALDRLNQQIAQLQNQNIMLRLPTPELRDMAQAMAELGVNISSVKGPEDLYRVFDALSPKMKQAVGQATDLKAALRGIQFDMNLDQQIGQLQIAAQYSGDLTVEERFQLELAQAKLQYHLQDNELLPDDIAKMREIAQLQQQAVEAARQKQIQDSITRTRQDTAEVRAQREAAGTPAGVISQRVLGQPSETARVEADVRRFQLENKGASAIDVAQAREAAQALEEQNTQLAIMNEVLPSVASSATDLIMAFQEGDSIEDVMRGILLSLERQAIQLAINIALAAALNALLGGAPAGAGGGAALGGGFGAFVGRQRGGRMRRGERAQVAEDRLAEIWLPDRALTAVAARGGDMIKTATQAGIPEAVARQLMATGRGGQALLGMAVEYGERPQAVPTGPSGPRVLGRHGPEIFVAPDDGQVISNRELRLLEAAPAGREMLRRMGRAKGGEVKHGQRYLTGEEDVEIFAPDAVLKEVMPHPDDKPAAYKTRPGVELRLGARQFLDGFHGFRAEVAEPHASLVATGQLHSDVAVPSIADRHTREVSQREHVAALRAPAVVGFIGHERVPSSGLIRTREFLAPALERFAPGQFSLGLSVAPPKQSFAIRSQVPPPFGRRHEHAFMNVSHDLPLGIPDQAAWPAASIVAPSSHAPGGDEAAGERLDAGRRHQPTPDARAGIAAIAAPSIFEWRETNATEVAHEFPPVLMHSRAAADAGGQAQPGLHRVFGSPAPTTNAILAHDAIAAPAIVALAALAAPAGDGGAMQRGGPFKRWQRAELAEIGIELLVPVGHVARAIMAGNLRSLPDLSRLPERDRPRIVARRQRMVADQDYEVIQTRDVMALANTSAGRALLAASIGDRSALPSLGVSPSEATIRHLQTGTANIDTTRYLASGTGGGGGGASPTVQVAGPSIQIIDQRVQGSPPVETTTTTGSDGRTVVMALIKSAEAERLRTGDHQAMMRTFYGISQRLR